MPRSVGRLPAAVTTGHREGSPERVVPYAVAALAVVVFGAVAVLWRPLAPPLSITAGADELFPPVLVAARDSTYDPRYIARLLEDLLTGLAVVVMAATPRVRQALLALAGGESHQPRRAAIVAAVMLAAAHLAVLPVAALLAYRWTGAIARNGAASWFADWLVAAVPLWGLVGVGAAVVTASARRWPRSWHWRLGLSATAVVAMVGTAGPWVIEPLTVRTRPLADGEVRAAVREVLVEAGMEEVSVVVGSGASVATQGAYVAGIGAARRVVLASALERFPPDQVAFVVAHEVAHSEHGDVPRTVLITSGWIVVGLALLHAALRSDRAMRWTRARSPTDPRLMVVMVVGAVLLAGVVIPLEAWTSRRSEAAADHFALQTVTRPEAAEDLFRTIVVTIGDDPEPPGWYQTLYRAYPSYTDRILRVREVTSDQQQ